MDFGGNEMTDLKRLGETRAELKRISEALYFHGIKIGPDEKWVVILKKMLDDKDAQIAGLEADMAGNVYTQGMVEQADAEISILRLELKECRASIWKEAAKMVKSVTPFNTLDMVAEALESRAREEGK